MTIFSVFQIPATPPPTTITSRAKSLSIYLSSTRKPEPFVPRFLEIFEQFVTQDSATCSNIFKNHCRKFLQTIQNCYMCFLSHLKHSIDSPYDFLNFEQNTI